MNKNLCQDAWAKFKGHRYSHARPHGEIIKGGGGNMYLVAAAEKSNSLADTEMRFSHFSFFSLFLLFSPHSFCLLFLSLFFFNGWIINNIAI